MRIPSHEFPDGFAEWLQPLFDARGRLLAGLGETERWVCRETVRHFVESGSGPSLDALRGGGMYPAKAVDTALTHLDERDLLVIDGDRVLSFYPFSDRPCRHRVIVEGRPFYPM